MSRLSKLCVAPLGIFFLGFVVLTYPTITRFSTHYFCDAGDGFDGVWNLWWVRTALLRGTHFWSTDFLHHPTGTMQIVLSTQIQLSLAERDSVIKILKAINHESHEAEEKKD